MGNTTEINFSWSSPTSVNLSLDDVVVVLRIVHIYQLLLLELILNDNAVIRLVKQFKKMVKMAYSVNTTPLLEGYDSDIEDERQANQEVAVRDDKPLFKPLEPKDKYYMSFLIFYLLGIVTLLPWNFYVTADDVSVL